MDLHWGSQRMPPSFQAQEHSVPQGANQQVPTDRQCRKYARLFLRTDQNDDGLVSANEALQLFSRSGLPKETLGVVWDFSDHDRDGSLSWPEFVVAMHLIRRARTQQILPDPSVGLHPQLTSFLSSIQDYRSLAATHAPKLQQHAGDSSGLGDAFAASPVPTGADGVPFGSPNFGDAQPAQPISSSVDAFAADAFAAQPGESLDGGVFSSEGNAEKKKKKKHKHKQHQSDGDDHRLGESLDDDTGRREHKRQQSHDHKDTGVGENYMNVDFAGHMRRDKDHHDAHRRGGALRSDKYDHENSFPFDGRPSRFDELLADRQSHGRSREPSEDHYARDPVYEARLREVFDEPPPLPAFYDKSYPSWVLSPAGARPMAAVERQAWNSRRADAAAMGILPPRVTAPFLNTLTSNFANSGRPREYRRADVFAGTSDPATLAARAWARKDVRDSDHGARMAATSHTAGISPGVRTHFGRI